MLYIYNNRVTEENGRANVNIKNKMLSLWKKSHQIFYRNEILLGIEIQNHKLE